ncbi:hypothetical protein Ctob_008335, partial [Chrysochromulina tobinii]
MLHALDDARLREVRVQLEGLYERARELVTDEGDIVGCSTMQHHPDARRVEALREKRAEVNRILMMRAASHRAEATDGGQDTLVAEIRKFRRSCGEVRPYWPQSKLDSKLETLRQIAALIGASCPEEAEDVVLSLSLEQVGNYLHRLAADPDFLNELRERRTALGAEGCLDKVLDDARKERRAHGGDDSPAACQAQARRCLRVLDVGRERWPIWEASRSKMLYERLGALSANNGSYVKEGDGVELAAMVDAGQLLLADSLEGVTAAAVLERMQVAAPHSAETLAWGEAVLGELRTLESLESHAAKHGGTSKSKEFKKRNQLLESAAKDASTGMQGEDAAFEAAQVETLTVVEIVFRSIFGTRQSMSASWMLEAGQFRGTSFTSGTFISRGVREERALIDDLDTRLAKGATYQELGFKTEEEARLFILSKRRMMDPHPDRSDHYSDTHLWDGLAATVSRSSGARQGEGEDGSNDGANAVLGRATKPGGARGKAPVDYMAAIAAPEAERAHHIVKIPAARDGTLAFFRARSQLHGATSADWRDVAIFYKNGETARLLQAVYADMPALQHVEPQNRAFGLALLKCAVLRHRETQIPALRKAGLWKQLQSKHHGETRYQSKHDLDLLGHK